MEERDKIRLVRSILGDREMRAKDIIAEATRMGFPDGRVINNWLLRWAKTGAVVRKPRHGWYAAGDAPLPAPAAEKKRVVPPPAPRLPASAEPPVEPEEPETPLAPVAGESEDGSVDLEQVYRQMMRWFHRAASATACDACGALAITGPVVGAAKAYAGYAEQLAEHQVARGREGMAEQVHKLKRENELLKRDLGEATRRIRELEAAACAGR